MNWNAAIFRLRRAVARSLSWLVLLLVSYVIAGWLLTPLLPRATPVVESYLSNMLAQPVSIGRLEGRWNGLGLELRLQGLAIGDSLAVSAVRAEPAPLSSLARGEMIFNAFRVSGVQLVLNADEAEVGTWSVPAFDNTRGNQSAQKLIATVLDQLLAQDAIQLTDSRLQFNGPDPNQSVRIESAVILGSGGRHEVRADVTFESERAPVRSSVQVDASGLRSGQADVQVFLRHGPVEVTGWLQPWLSDDIAPLRELALGAEWWLTWRDSRLRDVQVRASAGTARLGPESGTGVQIKDLSAALAWDLDQTTDQTSRVRVRDLSFQVDGKRWQPSAHDIDWSAEAFRLSSDRLDLGILTSLVHGWTDQTFWSEHSPEGLFMDSRVTVPRSDNTWAWRESTYSGRIQAGRFRAANNLPGFAGVNGRVQGRGTQGLLSFASGQDLAVDLEQWLPGTLSLGKLDGTLGWRYSPGAGLKIASSRLAFNWGEQGSARGRFAFSDMREAGSPEPVFALALAGEKLTHSGLMQGLPRVVPESVRGWMDGALSDFKGRDWRLLFPNIMADQSAVRVGHIGLELDDLRISLGAEAAQGRTWPDAHSLEGRLRVDAAGVRAQLHQGRFSGLQASNTQVFVPFRSRQPRVQIQGQAEGDLTDAWRVLTETPLHADIPATLDDWRVRGQVAGNVQLTIPLAKDLAPQAQVELTLDSGRLALDQPGLVLENLAGPLGFDLDQGLSSSGLSFQTWGGQHEAGITTEIDEDGAWTVVIPSRGRVSLPRVGDWLGWSWLRTESGAVDYQGTLTLNQQHWQVDLVSPTQGWQIDAPEPLGKTANEKKPLRLTVKGGGATAAMTLGGYFGQGLAGQAELSASGPRALAVRVGDAAMPTLRPDTWRVNLGLDTVSIPAWRDAFRQLMPETSWTRQVSSGLPGASTGLQLDFSMGSLVTSGATLNNLDLEVARSQNGDWSGRIGSDRVQGRLLAAGEEQPARLFLDQLRLGQLLLPMPDVPPLTRQADPGPQDAALDNGTRDGKNVFAPDPENDPLAWLASEWLFPLIVRIRNVVYNGRPLGSARFRLEPGAAGPGSLVLAPIQTSIRGLTAGGRLVWRRRPASRTELELEVTGQDVSSFLKASGMTPVLSSRDASADLKLTWAGSPAAFHWPAVKGNVNLRLNDGSLANLEQLEALRLVGLFNVTRILRRLSLDFRDVFSAGVSYDVIRGDLVFDAGEVSVGDELLLDGSGTKMFFEGRYDIVQDALNADGVVIARVSNAAGLLALGAGFSPPAALLVLFGERAFEAELERLFSVRVRVTGPLTDPQIETGQLFDSDIRGNDSTLEERARELFGSGE